MMSSTNISNPTNNRLLSTNSLTGLYQQLQSHRSQAVVNEPVTHDAIEWIEENFYIPETPDHRLRLAPYQKRALSEALRKDANGNFIYNTVVWSCIKKSLKSCIAAAMALYVAYSREWSTVYVIANDLKQAESRVAYYIRRAIELNPKMKAECKVKNYLTELPNHSKIEAIPIDPTGEAGSNADFLIFSELWGWKHESAQRMWTEMTLSPMKFGKSQRWVETYAGFEGESPILEQLFDTVVRDEYCIDREIEMYARDSMFALWNTKPMHEWQTPAYYASEELILVPTEFRRVHRNQWAVSSEAFVPREWWDACNLTYPQFNQWTPMVIAIDAATVSDHFAMVGVSIVDGVTYKRFFRRWTPPPNGGEIDYDEPMQELVRLSREYNLECCCYDPKEMIKFAQDFTRQYGTVHMFEFGQGDLRLEADKALYDGIRFRKIAHDGEEALTEYVMNANRELNVKLDNKLRIIKRHADKKIDGVVALSMAHYRALMLQLG